MNNLNQSVTKKEAIIKQVVLVILGTIVFAIFILPVKELLIGLAVVLPVMILSAIWGFKNQSKVRRMFRVYIIIGIFSIFFGVSSLFIGERGTEHYIGIGVGLYFIYYGFKKKRALKDTIS